MAKIRFFPITRNGMNVSAVWSEDGKIKSKNFPLSMTNEQIMAEIRGFEIKPEVKTSMPEITVDLSNVKPPVSEMPISDEKVNKQKDRLRMIKELNAAGVTGMNTAGYDAVLAMYNQKVKK